nr:70 kDa heat shock protein [Mimivirus sp.]
MNNNTENYLPELDYIEQNNEIVIGIDLGTRFSCASVWRNKRFEIIPDQFGNRTIPSVVSYYKSAKLVGNNALSMKDINPKNTIYDIKRIIGRRMNDASIGQTKKLISYNLVDDDSPHHNILIQLDTQDVNITRKKLYKPEEICAQILMEIKKWRKII